MKRKSFKNTLKEKLDQADILNIKRKAKTNTYRELAEEYNVGLTTIWRIVNDRLSFKK